MVLDLGFSDFSYYHTGILHFGGESSTHPTARVCENHMTSLMMPSLSKPLSKVIVSHVFTP